MKKKKEAIRAFGELVEVVEKLGGRGGCPWDRAQTLESIRPCLVEEACEVLEAVDERDREKLEGELGDLLYLVLFCVRLADREGAFTLEDVLGGVSNKLVRRHPGVFGPRRARSQGEASRLWHESKSREKVHRSRCSILDGIPRCLPSLQKAHKVQSKAARVGFDWPSLDDMLPKIEEETRELKRCIERRDRERIADELGDLFFTLVNASRFLDLDPETVVQGATTKFSRRFREMERRLTEKGMENASLEEMDSIWEKIKKNDQ